MPDGSLGERQVLAVSFMHSTPTLVDFDGDGDLDMISSAYPLSDVPMSVAYLENVGSRNEPEFVWPIDLLKDLEDPGGYYTSIVAYDWDSDGLLDLIAARRSSIYFFRNIGNKDKPKFDSSVILKRGLDYFHERTADVPWGTSLFLHICDWNGDGQADLLVGDNQLNRSPKPGLGIKEELQLAMAQARNKAYSRKVQEIENREIDKYLPRSEQHEKMMNIFYSDSMKEVMAVSREDNILIHKLTNRKMHGYVWLFLGVPGKAAAK